MMRADAAAPPQGILLLLTAAVAVAHVWVLETAPLQLGASDGLGRKVFSTRLLELGQPAQGPAPPVAASPVPAPAPRPVQRSAAPTVAATQSASPAQDVLSAAPQPAPEPVAQVQPPVPAASAPVAESAPPPAAPLAAALPAEAASPSAPRPGATAAADPPLAKDAALPPRRYAVPGSVRLKFNATGSRQRMDYYAMGEMLWQHDGKSYEARLSMTAWPMSRTLSSTGQLSADGLAPARFSDKFRSELAAHFDRDRARVTFSANTPDAALLPGAQDQLSVFVQLAAMLGGDPAGFPEGSSISVQAVGPRAAEPWVFVFEGEETLSLPGGQQATRRLVRSPRRDYDQKVEIWLAPALSWLPARIRITQANGDFIDQQWRSTGSP